MAFGHSIEGVIRQERAVGVHEIHHALMVDGVAAFILGRMYLVIDAIFLATDAMPLGSPVSLTKRGPKDTR
jgi:hypothetical protein